MRRVRSIRLSQSIDKIIRQLPVSFFSFSLSFNKTENQKRETERSAPRWKSKSDQLIELASRCERLINCIFRLMNGSGDDQRDFARQQAEQWPVERDTIPGKYFHGRGFFFFFSPVTRDPPTKIDLQVKDNSRRVHRTALPVKSWYRGIWFFNSPPRTRGFRSIKRGFWNSFEYKVRV